MFSSWVDWILIILLLISISFDVLKIQQRHAAAKHLKKLKAQLAEWDAIRKENKNA